MIMTIGNSSFGGTKKMNCIFSTQGRAFCILRVIDTGLSLLYRVGEKKKFCLNEGKGYMYPQMKKPVGMLVDSLWECATKQAIRAQVRGLIT
jgi:hypothetical protein